VYFHFGFGYSPNSQYSFFRWRASDRENCENKKTTKNTRFTVELSLQQIWISELDIDYTDVIILPSQICVNAHSSLIIYFKYVSVIERSHKIENHYKEGYRYYK